MIQLTRERTTTRIPARFRGPGRLKSERALLRLHATRSDPKSSVWSAAKPQLRRESRGKCAYCEGKADIVAHCDVEHFRPKSDYWSLAYCYDNYTFACQICNQTFKGSEFPKTGPRLVEPNISEGSTDAFVEAFVGQLGPDPLDPVAVAAFHAKLAGEMPGLPDPYLMDPEPLFQWFADDVIREVEVRARDQSPASQTAFAAVDKYLGLNRQELKLWRWQTYKEAQALAMAFKQALPAAVATAVREALLRMMSPEGQFSAMVRYVVRDVEGLPL